MKSIRDSVTAALLLALLACGTLLVLSHPRALVADFFTYYAQARAGTEYAPPQERFPSAVSGGQHALTRAVSRHTGLITLYGGFQRLIGSRIVHDASQNSYVARLENGQLNFIVHNAAPGDPSRNAARTSDFAVFAAERGIPTLFVLAPQKIGDERLKPAGAVEYGNADSDRFLSLLQSGVGVLDLRPAFRENHSALFFNTDHHWTPEGAFLAFRQIAARLEADYGFPIDPAVTDRGNYRATLYPDFFLGSQGKRVGPLYAGMDDFSLLLPAEQTTGFTFRIPHKDVTRAGSFEDAFLFSEMLNAADPYTANPYVAYTGGDYPLSIAENANSPGGQKILLLRQSFSCALAPFLSRACARLDIIDPRYFEESIRDYVDQTRPDLILIVYAASDTCNDALFAPLEAGFRPAP